MPRAASARCWPPAPRRGRRSWWRMAAARTAPGPWPRLPAPALSQPRAAAARNWRPAARRRGATGCSSFMPIPGAPPAGPPRHLGRALAAGGLAPPIRPQPALPLALVPRRAAAADRPGLFVKGDTLIVFARAPRLGTVKRRLARGIGAMAALRFYRGQL